MKYNVGDKVRINSIDWYNKNKDEYGNIDISHDFTFYADRSKYCGKVFTIDVVFNDCYTVKEDNHEYYWADEMIEGLVEEETLIERVDDSGLPFNEWLSHKGAFYIPDGYVLKDDNGNEILTSKIVLEKEKKKYPKTYEECCEIVGGLADYVWGGYKQDLFKTFHMLYICRDAYWKIAGEEMGLGKPWEPDWSTESEIKYVIEVYRNNVRKNSQGYSNTILAFPTAEMRDAFKENFDPDLEICKEFL